MTLTKRWFLILISPMRWRSKYITNYISRLWLGFIRCHLLQQLSIFRGQFDLGHVSSNRCTVESDLPNSCSDLRANRSEQVKLSKLLLKLIWPFSVKGPGIDFGLSYLASNYGGRFKEYLNYEPFWCQIFLVWNY